jgi:hypothetical protein
VSSSNALPLDLLKVEPVLLLLLLLVVVVAVMVVVSLGRAGSSATCSTPVCISGISTLQVQEGKTHKGRCSSNSRKAQQGAAQDARGKLCHQRTRCALFELHLLSARRLQLQHHLVH